MIIINNILFLNVKMYLWLKLYTVPILVSGQTYKIRKGSNNYCSHCIWLNKINVLGAILPFCHFTGRCGRLESIWLCFLLIVFFSNKTIPTCWETHSSVLLRHAVGLISFQGVQVDNRWIEMSEWAAGLASARTEGRRPQSRWITDSHSFQGLST